MYNELMQAQVKSLVEFLQGKHQLVIPIYQRPYSWSNKQLERLWQDIINISEKEENQHFLGSIVRIKPRIESREISEQAIIDGQQRITTIFILISAIIRSLKPPRDEEWEVYLINKYATGSLHYKLWSTDTDRQTLNDLITRNPSPNESSERVLSTFKFFRERIEKQEIDPEYLLRGIRQLVIVDICLDPERDDPQLIFESLNSTGLALSQSDLIRNFILMDRSPKEQEKIYRDHWHKMEHSFDRADNKASFDRFIRDYLTIQNNGKIPVIRDVYETFKKWFREQQDKDIEELIKHIHQYSTCFIRMTNPKSYETDPDLRSRFTQLKELDVHVAFPFLMAVYHDYHPELSPEKKIIDKSDFLKILKLIESYVLRRFICGIQTNALNKVFATLYTKISLNKDEYIEYLEVALLNFEGALRFPGDSEVKNALKLKTLYGSNNCLFILRQIENHLGGKEPINTDKCTIEHIMPQELSEAWKGQLGSDWQRIHETYLHTLGNLTLTAYNAEMGNKSFSEKKDIYSQSPLFLNKQLKISSIWAEQQILERTEELANIILSIWQRPILSQEILIKYQPQEQDTNSKTYSLETNHPSVAQGGSMEKLFNDLHVYIMNLDSSVKQDILKIYIAYKIGSAHLVDIYPRKDYLDLVLNIEIDEISDPKKLCEDISGSRLNGNTKTAISSISELQDAMDLIKQAFKQHY